MIERPEQDAPRALDKAAELFSKGIVQSLLVQREGRLAGPIPVHEPEGDISSWFIGVQVGDRLAGFIHLDRRLELLRYSTFQRHPGSLEGCPSARSWIDPQYVLELAMTQIPRGMKAAEPYMTYDQDLSRLTWAVPWTDMTGLVHTVFVAGEFVYTRSAKLGSEGTTD
jgi:hypothetical protein